MRKDTTLIATRICARCGKVFETSTHAEKCETCKSGGDVRHVRGKYAAIQREKAAKENTQ